MPLTLVDETNEALPVWLAETGGLDALPEAARAWARVSRFTAEAGSVLIVPGQDGRPAGAVLGLGKADHRGGAAEWRGLLAGALAGKLPDGEWRFAKEPATIDRDVATLALLLGQYRFARYRSGAKGDDAQPQIRFQAPDAIDRAELAAVADAVFLARDLINTPANDMGPAELEAAARSLAQRFGAAVETIEGDELLVRNFPMIHAVGRASASAPRLIDLTWGKPSDPKVTLVGKGVIFDTGGLDIKPASGMLLMKKDMGGAANVLALAQMVMARGLAVRLRVLIPAVENAISGSAFRPGDILTSRKGKTVEIGNTDAEGRLVLADALALADEEAPEMLIDMATLTGAARVALGPDLPPFYTEDDGFAAELAAASRRVADPLWRMPLWQPYAANLSSKIADTNNVTSDAFAGSVTAALFLQGFVEKAAVWAHLDVFGWRPKPGPTGPVGGEAQGVRALYEVLKQRYPGAPI
ncbi:MAG: leucyl aminopeptidase family protein [Aurantimonas endophytica]|uniref:Leucyl aminopeptidase n=1 Tax=Aurantimonas endophytica TaxID=1522175 RepID=A0A7W6HCU4_9HYPH|nr:leucyl aminopeptidase family protein [Aurantimonas endophytica]MBB4002686.1 leucyl aminopeptidase [Aurantimonas endophytica]MCO6403566.1 leucyl aminopeptidase family protein [Aurantimonas endophytica]